MHADYLGRHQSAVVMANDGWVFTAFSRYCPRCLAETAENPGGPIWPVAWRLPHTSPYSKELKGTPNAA
ncbi:TniQ family protein [Streptomyces longwoodensis]|uniref:TniQ family protein n=1 Tax=Streptomyces longwoodensis TaxID=68231 RepID=UPI0033F6CB51